MSEQEKERYKNIANYEEYYQISNFGNVYSKIRLTYQQIADKFNVSYHVVHDIRKGKTWQHILK
jgi:hypothetical protein